ncbi:uncharacterized protein LTR77_006975 [Saxophila tyrrhenica]|uniref:Serine aminopeptidase S33 domain-containing protein n=1 Tax=Saxophila tyrrhenica TaxID=1690608 RepID=A0AAV9P9S3_9PEZI|nr:hypothetical protein LTR77_006975 [Saxophila tyrrhenica]
MAEPLLSAHSVGEGIPVLVIHGWELDGSCEALDFELVFTTLSGFQRIYVDLPGMGATPAGNVRSLDDMYLRLVHFVDTTISTSRFLVIGSSCGAYLARALADRYRQQVDGLLLRVPLVEPENSKRDVDPFRALVENEELMAGVAHSDRTYLGDVLVQTPEYLSNLQSKVDGGVRAAILKSDAAVLNPIRSDVKRYRLSPQLDAGSEKFPAPTLILSGRQDEVTGYRDSLRLLEFYPRSTFAVLDRETHALPVDERTVFEALVKNWLYRVQEWQGGRG